jgi:hypothetical protein
LSNKLKTASKNRRGRQRQNGQNGHNGSHAAGPAKGRNGKSSDPRANYKRYTELAREAASAGDSVQSEYYYQHADHYHRLMSGS